MAGPPHARPAARNALGSRGTTLATILGFLVLAGADEPPKPGPPGARADPAQGAAAADLERLRGDWKVLALASEGRVIPTDGSDFAIPGDDDRHPLRFLQFRGAQWVERDPEKGVARPLCTLALDPAASPRAIDLVRPDGTLRGIYKVDGIFLTLCLDTNPANGRPRLFAAPWGSSLLMVECIRKRADPTAGAARAFSLADFEKLAAEASAKLPDLSPTRLAHLTDDQLKELERIYKDQCEMLRRSARADDDRLAWYGPKAEVQARRTGNLDRFDAWAHRAGADSLARILAADSRRVVDYYKSQSGRGRAEADRLEAQGKLIRKRRAELLLGR